MGKEFTSFSKFTLAGVLYFIYLKLSGKELVVQGQCKMCGNCCRAINLEGPEGWLKSRKHFKNLLKKNGEFKRFSVLRKDSSGYLVFRCNKLTADGLCCDYENRPDVCRNFPNRNLLFCGGQLPAECGYRFVMVKSFGKILTKKLDKKNL